MSAQSIAAVEDIVDLTQFRVLVVIASRGSLSLGELADAARLHLSRASRLCDRLVGRGLVNRITDPTDRRQLVLSLTDQGRAVVHEVMRRRRAALQPIMRRLGSQTRADLVALLEQFAAAAGEPAEPDLWFMGWST